MPSNTRFHLKKAVSFQVPPLISEYFFGGTKIGVFFNIAQKGEGGGGSKAFWTILKKTTEQLVPPGFPYFKTRFSFRFPKPYFHFLQECFLCVHRVDAGLLCLVDNMTVKYFVLKCGLNIFPYLKDKMTFKYFAPFTGSLSRNKQSRTREPSLPLLWKGATQLCGTLRSNRSQPVKFWFKLRSSTDIA